MQGKFRVEVNPMKEHDVMMKKHVADQENRLKEAALDKKIKAEITSFGSWDWVCYEKSQEVYWESEVFWGWCEGVLR